MNTNGHESRRAYFYAFLAILSGCARYSDFTLPPPDAGGLRPPFRWVATPGPVLERGAAGDVLNPSVIRFRGGYLNLYSEYDGRRWHTAVAASTDGFHWDPRGRVLSPQGWEGNYIAGNGSAVVVNDEIFYWYQAGDPPRIALARSNDGKAWTREPEAVVPLGPRGSFDERGVSDPYVIRSGDAFYLFYTGLDRARRQRLGIAKSVDGIVWSKLRSNPILEVGGRGAFDENGLGEPAVWSSAGFWWMLYTGRSVGEQRRIGLAKSADGIHWDRDMAFRPIAGSEPWDREVVCDPTLEVTPGELRVWFGGGDVSSPDQNLHGQIGFGVLKGSQ